MKASYLAASAAVMMSGIILSTAIEAAEADRLEEVVVTATLRSMTDFEVPASVTLLSGDRLSSAGVQHLEDLLPQVPNLNWASGTSRPRYFQLRGIGETDQWQGAPNPSVGFLIDGMDFSGIGMPAGLLDLAQVEVLRGPQGTTLGANALAGLINLQTRAPDGLSATEIYWQTGERGLQSVGTVLAGSFSGADESALSAASGWRLSAQKLLDDGSRINRTLGRQDTNGLDETTVRWRSRHQVLDHWQADLSVLWVDQQNGFDAFAIDNSRETLTDDPGADEQQSRGVSVHLVRPGEIFFSSQSSLVEADILYSFDGDWAADPSYDFTSRFLRARQTWTQDLRWGSTAPNTLRSATGNNTRPEGALSWVAGVYGLRVSETNDQLDLYGGEVFRALVSDYQADHLAAYGELAWGWSPAWQLTLGLRAERRETRYQDSDGSDLDPAENMWGGNISLNYQSSAENRWYLSLARGYKAGGFNLGAVIPEAQRQFGAERLVSAELGHKRRWAEDRGAASMAFFYMRRLDQQVSTSAQIDPGDPLSFIYLTANAAEGANYGLEADASLRLGQGWRITSSVAWLQAKFKDYQTVERDLRGRKQAHAPEWQVMTAISYSRPTGWFTRAEAQYQSGFFFSDSHDQQASSRLLLNLAAGYERNRWRVELWMRNALNEDYAQRGFFFGNEPPDFPDRLYIQLAEPRRAGLSARWAFN